ncbi:hypothetical protein Mpal_2069 [Methanosphaerula palustris E1-9c]|uniref:Uncharacterized protein n=1 Tax=Methanosphaerula palustris (strain ATCC BAA-1556 / DSM 19958 / E1-9c) TaxID=521011 RepID=B8GDL7_METPE|nr:hypothetical protein Mpal_2069 [Methanosphaerula palustris E1-9c]
MEPKPIFARFIRRKGHWFRESFSKKGNGPESYTPVQVKLIQLMLT